MIPEIHVRALEDTDAVLTHSWRQDRVASDYALGYVVPASLEAEREWLRSCGTTALSERVCLGIETGVPRRLVGYVQLRGIDWISRTAEFGIFIGDPGARGQGIGRAATLFMVDFSFRQLGLEKLWLRVADYNHFAHRLYERCGFRLEGELLSHVFRNGARHGLRLYGLLRDVARDSPST